MNHLILTFNYLLSFYVFFPSSSHPHPSLFFPPSLPSSLLPSFPPFFSPPSLSTTQLLDVHFTSESLAAALGISQSMGLIRNHLSRKFTELIGPIAAQKKYDAMLSKNFVALDPNDVGKVGHRVRSRSMGSRRGRNQEAQENLLCPLDKFPATG